MLVSAQTSGLRRCCALAQLGLPLGISLNDYNGLPNKPYLRATTLLHAVRILIQYGPLRTLGPLLRGAWGSPTQRLRHLHSGAPGPFQTAASYGACLHCPLSSFPFLPLGFRARDSTHHHRAVPILAQTRQPGQRAGTRRRPPAFPSLLPPKLATPRPPFLRADRHSAL